MRLMDIAASTDAHRTSLPVVAAAVVIALLGTYAAGLASQTVATLAIQAGLFVPLRDAVCLGLVLAVLFLWHRSGRLVRAPTWGAPVPALLAACTVGLLPLALAWGGMALAGAVQTEPVATGALAAAIAGLPFLLMHGLAEQTLVRRLAQGQVQARFGALAGIAVGAAVWTGVQWLQGYGGPLEVLNSFLLAVLLGLVARGPGGVIAAGLAQGLWTWAEVVLLKSGLGLTVLADEAPWAGSGSDTYGSVIFTLALLLTGAVLVRRDRDLWPPRGTAA
jgi:hypothetical protein